MHPAGTSDPKSPVLPRSPPYPRSVLAKITASSNHVRILVNYAKSVGWQPVNCSSPDWRQVVIRADEQNCGDLA